MSSWTEFVCYIKTSHSLLNGQYQIWWNTRQNYMKLHASFTLSFKYYRQVLFIKRYFLPCCFRWAFTSADIIFCNFFLTSFNIVWKKDFRHKFSFFNGFTQTHNPLNGQNLLSVTKSFCPYSLTFCKESLPVFACAQ